MQKKPLVSRHTPLYVKLYWVALVIFTVLAIAMCYPLIAVYLRVIYLAGGAYYGFPGLISIIAYWISFTLTNLWWVLALIAPLVWYRQTRPLLGVAISVVGFAVVLLLPSLIIKSQTDAMLAEASANLRPIKVVKNVTSVTLASRKCDDLCERLLRGNAIKTVRTLKPKDFVTPHLLYRREPAQYCQKYDPLFKDDEICVVTYVDDKVKSDLVIEKKNKGSRAVKRGRVGFKPRLLRKETVQIREHKSQDIVASGVKINWIEPKGYVPLMANTGFDGRGIHGGGLIPRQIKRESASMDAAILLEKMGIDLAPSLLTKIKRSKWSKRYGLRSKTYRNPAPYDVALIYSIWELNGLSGKRPSQFFVNWGKRFSQKGMSATKSENLLLVQFLANMNTFEHRHKRYIREPLRHLILKQTPEQNVVFEKYFLEKFKNKNRQLIDLVGRFAFDPEPILRKYLPTIRETKYRNFVFKALCRSDPRWVKKLTPLILDYALSIPENMKLRQKRFFLYKAFAAFEVHGQKEAWVTLKQNLSPATLDKLKFLKYDGKASCR